MNALKMLIAVLVWLAASLAPPALAGEADDAREQAQADREREEEHLREAERQLREAQREFREAARRVAEINRRLSREQIDLRLAEEYARAQAEAGALWLADRPVLGVVIEANTEDARGAVITAVSPGGPADQAGLKTGDVIVSVDGRPLLSSGEEAEDEDEAEDEEDAEIVRKLRIEAGPPGRRTTYVRSLRLKEGQKVTVEYLRGKERRKVEIVPRRLGRHKMVVAVDPESIKADEIVLPELPNITALTIPRRWLDMQMVALNPDLGDYFGTDEGVLVVRAPGDEALKLRGGDVILRIGDQEVSSPPDATRILRAYDPGDPVEIEIVRHRDRMTLKASAPEMGARRAPAPPAPPAPRAPRPPRAPKAPPAPDHPVE